MTKNTNKYFPQPGAEIGCWTVIDEVNLKGKERRWLCRCKCGTERTVLDRSLRYGTSFSCGCSRLNSIDVGLEYDLSGKQYGELHVLNQVVDSKNSSSGWLCQCSCGEQCVILGRLLVSGKRTNCSGKAHIKNYSFRDITNHRYGRLVALYRSGKDNKSGSIVWHCRCDCGNEIDLSYNTLVYTKQKSCGCQKKENDQKLHGFLTHVDGTSINLLKSKKVPTDNTTGYKGVYFVRGKYIAKIVFQKKQYLLGTYDNIQDAVKARTNAEIILFDGAAEHYKKWKQFADKDLEWAARNPIQIKVERTDHNFNVSFLPDLP